MFFRRKKQTPAFLSSGKEKIAAAVVQTAGPLIPIEKSPDESMGALFNDVQISNVFPDGKTFPDLIPRKSARLLAKEYEAKRRAPNFQVDEFVRHNFDQPHAWEAGYRPDDATTAREHVTALWTVLRRRNRRNRGSLFALPNDYIVPGGRFAEQFYWDTYFIMLGLAADDEWRLIQGMMQNYGYMLRRFGFIPTANRTYFLSRSQPPFFSQMVKLLASHNGRGRTYAEYLPAMLSEYRFWMKGRKTVSETPDTKAYARVVCMPDGTILNRYFDNKTVPRPESMREDVETAGDTQSEQKGRIYLDLRAGAESGWDFSSRWLRSHADMRSIHTTDVVPVDLNCLMYQLEQTLVETYTLLKQPILANRFRVAAERRARAIRSYCWNASEGFFVDYDIHAKRRNHELTLAGVFPLYARIATNDQAAKVAEMIETRFLKKGGLVTTLVDSGQQWDSPNGWAPLQWITIKGLREYGYFELANKIRDRWLGVCDEVFVSQHKMLEKYDVIHGGAGLGGEYPLQDGFGWTNGVYAALYDEKEAEHGR